MKLAVLKVRQPALWLTLLLIVALLASYLIFRDTTISDTDKLIKQVSKLTVLPDETPIISTLVDKAKANQPFLANAAEGDKILVYPKAKLAIVWRPSTKKIINLGNIQLPPARVFIRTGSAQDVSEFLKAKIEQQAADFKVLSKDRSSRPNYDKTIVVDLTGLRADLANRLAQIIGGTVLTDLPDGESRPEGDLLIISGGS